MSDTPKKRLGAKAKLRQYIIKNVGKVMSSDELRTIADDKASGGGAYVSYALRKAIKF